MVTVGAKKDIAYVFAIRTDRMIRYILGIFVINIAFM